MTRLTTCVLGTVLLIQSDALADPPAIVESGWTMTREVDFQRPLSPRIHPIDGLLYVLRSEGSGDGLYRIGTSDAGTLLAAAADPAALEIDPTDGDFFVSEHYGGRIYRTAFGGAGRETWVDGLHAGDDDPVGMAIAPLTYGGSVIAPGDAVVVDWGNSGPDDVWAWSPSTAEGEVVVHDDDGTLVEAMDVVISDTNVWVIDHVGNIYDLAADGTLTALTTSEPITSPMGITIDVETGDLIVMDYNGGAGRIVRVDPVTGSVSDVVTGLVLDISGLTQNWASVHVSQDGRHLTLCEHTEDKIWVLSRCDVIDPEDDCNANGVHDDCDIALGNAEDCNGNGRPDSCDVESGDSSDCDGNGVPDECPICPPVEVVFVMDTSSSMSGEGAALCATIDSIVLQLQATGIDVTPSLWGVAATPGGGFSCLTDNVLNALGNTVPGNPPPGLEIFGDCPGGSEIATEDWGLAVAMVSGLFPWQQDSLRLIVPLSDEGPWCGDPLDSLDNASIIHAIAVSNDNDVIVSPVTASGSSAGVIALAQQLAQATGGLQFSSTETADDLADGILSIILDACLTIADCNDNGVPDECDIDQGTSNDADRNGIPDECECEGDLNFDGVVNVSDLLLLLGAWGPCDGACPADLDNNGSVEVTDLLTLLANWGPC